MSRIKKLVPNELPIIITIYKNGKAEIISINRCMARSKKPLQKPCKAPMITPRNMLAKVIKRGITASEFKKIPVKKVSTAYVLLIQLLQMDKIAKYGDKYSHTDMQTLITMSIDGIKR